MKLGITIYTQERIWSGHVNLRPEERLSDLFNDAFVEKPGKRTRFLQVEDVTVNSMDNTTMQKLEIGYLSKAAIVLVVPYGGDLDRGVSGSGNPKNHLFVYKKPELVKLTLPFHEIEGHVHCAIGETPLSLLEEQQGYVPLADVKIRIWQTRASWTHQFALVNTDHILSFSVVSSDSSH